MIICLDTGNSHIHGGIYTKNHELIRSFRYDSRLATTSDQLGVFLKNIVQEENINIADIQQIAICSVVDQLDYSLRAACIKYFKLEPFFLRSGVKTGLKMNSKNPSEVGSDMIACAVAAQNKYPNKDIIIADFGTATNYSMISHEKGFMGAIIYPGLKLSMQSLVEKTSRLYAVEIIKPESIMGRSTVTAIQSGLYYSQLGALKEILKQIKKNIFPKQKPIIIATGGFNQLFNDQNLFDEHDSDLVHKGLLSILEKNTETTLKKVQ